ncbi:MAG: spondin domain-containing protein [Phycisphaerales bacterium]
MKINQTMRIVGGIVALAAMGAHGETISVSIENMMDADSFFFTPVWIAAHDGSFDTYNLGDPASNFPGLTDLAEGGNTAPLSASFAASSAGMAGGAQGTVTATAFAGDAPVFSPGESTTFDLDVGDASINRYFSFASMIIPSNDLFFANDNATAYQIFDAMGNFTGTTVIDIFGRDVLDNGSELNDALGGAAFSANGGTSVDEFGAIRNLFSDAGDAAYLDSFIGSNTANGATIGSSFGADDLIARITINQVPAPSSAALLLGAGVMTMRRRR